MFRILWLSIISIFCFASCKMVSLPVANNEYVVQKAGNSIAIFHYNTSGVIGEYFLIQQAGNWPDKIVIKQAEFVGSKYIHISPESGQSLYYTVGNTNEVPSGGKAYPVTGLVYTQVLDRNTNNNKDVFRFAMNALNPSDADCDKSCMSGGCGRTSAMHTDQESVLRTKTHVTCAEGYFACVGSINTFSSRCIRNTCCEN